MAWVRFRRLAAFPEGVHRVGRAKQEIVFNAAIEDGLVDVRHRDDLAMLLRLPEYEIALERYGVRYDTQGWEQEPSVSDGVTTPPSGKRWRAHKPGRPPPR